MPDFVGFYRWHVPDPVMFVRDLKVTIQQIGAAYLSDDNFDAFAATHPAAGRGWFERPGGKFGIHERTDDYCAAAFVYCTTPQAVPRLDVGEALQDIARRDHEPELPMERFLSP
jgi:hypothetical protein